MIESKKPKINPEFQVEKFDNEILLYTPTDTKAVYLNETAYLIWQICGGERTVGDIIQLLEEEYPGQKDVIRNDVIAALQTLVDSGAIVLEDER